MNLDEIMHLFLIHQNRGSTQEHSAPSSFRRTSQEMGAPTKPGRFTFRVWLFQDGPTNVYTLIGGAILLLARAGSEPTEWNKAQASASYMRIQQQ
jgi:hypothetical protein